MLFGIRGQLTIVVIMLVSSTGFTWALACVYTHINVHTRTRASPTTSQKQYDEVNKQMLVSSPRSKGHHSGNAKRRQQGSWLLMGIVLCSFILA